MAAASIPPEQLRRRRVEFPSKQEGVKLVGELVWPSWSAPPRQSISAKTPLPVAVLAHGLADDRDSFVLPRLAEELAARAGVASLRFDFRGNGESGGTFRFGNAATADGEPADLEAAVEFVNGFRGGAEEEKGGDGGGRGGRGEEEEDEEERELRFEVVALLGHSKAGSAVVSYAARRRGTTGGAAAAAAGRASGEEEGGQGEGEGAAARRKDPLFVPLVVSVAARFDHADRRAIASRFGGDIFERVREAEGEGGVPLTWRVGSRPKESGGGGRSEEGTEAAAAAEGKPPPRRVLRWRLTASDLEDRLATDMGALCRQLPRETRLLLVHGAADATVPPSAAGRYAAEAKGRTTTSRIGPRPTS